MYGNFGSSSGQQSGKLDLMDKAKKKLNDARTRLSKSVHDADHNIKVLEKQKAELEPAMKAATVRYKKVKKFTEAVCDNCWDVLPALGNLASDDSGEVSFGGVPRVMPPFTFGGIVARRSHCISCGNAMTYSPPRTTQKLPPSSISSITAAQEAVKYADDVASGKITQDDSYHQYGYGYSQSNSSYKAQWSSREESGNRSFGYNASPKVERKKDLLDRAKVQKKNVENELQSVDYAISQWKIYREEHRTQLTGISAKETTFQDRHRKVLEDKLRQLGGTVMLPNEGATTLSSLTNCNICMARRKDTVFQCGHQCCSLCSTSVSLCHSCRTPITQRIRLYD